MRIGIIGCGLIGQKRAKAATGHEIVVVCDQNESRANDLAKVTNAKAVQDYRQVLQHKLDLCIIATTHNMLAPISYEVAKLGMHVLVEKPAAINYKELLKLSEIAREKNVLVKVGFNHRFHPAIQKAKELVTSNELGTLMYIRGRYGHGARLGYEQEWRCNKEISGGGELIDQGSHLIDLSNWFLGNLSLEYAYTPTFYWKIGVDDNCFLALKGAHGEMAWLHASWSEWKNTFSFEITGRTGKLHIEGLGGSYGTERLTHYHMLPEMGPPQTNSWEYPFPDKSWDLEFKDFVSAISDKRRPCGDIEDALSNLKIVEDAYKAQSN